MRTVGESSRRGEELLECDILCVRKQFRVGVQRLPRPERHAPGVLQINGITGYGVCMNVIPDFSEVAVAVLRTWTALGRVGGQAGPGEPEVARRAQRPGDRRDEPRAIERRLHQNCPGGDDRLLVQPRDLLLLTHRPKENWRARGDGTRSRRRPRNEHPMGSVARE